MDKMLGLCGGLFGSDRWWIFTFCMSRSTAAPNDSDEDYSSDKTAVSHNDADDQSQSRDPSDAVSVGTTTSTLLDSCSDEALSRDAASSTNHVAASSDDVTWRSVGNSRCDLSLVSRADAGDVGPPWLPASGDTLLHSDALPSLQFGASSLLALVYDRPSNATHSLATADHVGTPTAVLYSAHSTSISPSSSSNATVSTAKSAQCPVQVNVRQVDKLPVISDSVAEYHQTEVYSDGIVEPSALQLSTLSSTPNVVCDASLSHSTVTRTTGDDHWPSDISTVTRTTGVTVAPLPEPVLDEQRRECANSPRSDINEPPNSTTTAVLHIEDYLLSDLEETGRSLTNGSTNVDDEHAVVVRQNGDVARDATIAYEWWAPAGKARHVTRVSRTVDTSTSISDRLRSELVASCDVSYDEPLTYDHHAVCVNGHLRSTTGDVHHDPCRPCHDSKHSPPSCGMHSSDAPCDLNSNITSPISATATCEGVVKYDGHLDELEARDVDECQRVAEQMSAAWSSTEATFNFDHVDAHLVPPTSSTARLAHNIYSEAEDFLDSDEWMEDDFVLPSREAVSSHDGLKSPPPYSHQSTLTDFADMSAEGVIAPTVLPLVTYEMQSPSAIPRSSDVIQPLVSAAVDVFWQCRRYGESWDDVSPPLSYLVSADDDDDADEVCAASRRVHRRLVFDLVAEILRDIYDDDDAADVSPPLHDERLPRRRPPPRRPRRFAVAPPLPTTVDCVKPVVERRVLDCLRLTPSDDLFSSLARKRGVDRRLRDDAVDRMLVDELCLEEPGWVDYDDDVTTRKLQLSEWLQEALLADTVCAVDNALHRRHYALTSLNSLV